MQSLDKNLKAFLDMIALSEGTPQITGSDNGYNVIVGSTPSKPDLFDSYADHPRKKIFLPKLHLYSSAAGRYQLEAHWYDPYKRLLELPDFSPESQDAIALQQIKERKAVDDIISGRIIAAIARCSNIWASLPGNDYNQHQNSVAALMRTYTDAGGTLLAT